MKTIKYNSLIEMIRALPDEKSCIAYLEDLRWGDMVVSPYGTQSKVYKTKRGYRCASTGKDFNVLTGTFMKGTKVPLIKWLMAMWLLNSEKKGLSSHNLARKIEVSQNTAWYMLHRLRLYNRANEMCNFEKRNVKKITFLSSLELVSDAMFIKAKRTFFETVNLSVSSKDFINFT